MNGETGRKFIIMSVGLLGVAITIIYGCGRGANEGPLGPSGAGSLPATVTISPSSMTIAQGGNQTFTATGGSAPYTWSINDSNKGSIVAATGVFTAGITAGTVTVTATDTDGNAGTGTVTIVSAVIIVSPPSPKLTKGSSQTFTATGGTAPYTWSISDSSKGSIIVSTGIFTAGITTGTVTATATDANSNTGTGTITIISSTIIVTPVTVTIPNTITVPYTQTFTGSTGTSPYSYNISGAANGYTGAIMDLSTGDLTISVIPTSSQGSQTLTITATDSLGDTGTSTATVQSVVITVTPSIASISATSSTTFSASGGTTPYTYSLSGATNGYTGSAINSTTGVLTVTTLPTNTEKTQTLTITATDADSNTGTATVTVNTA